MLKIKLNYTFGKEEPTSLSQQYSGDFDEPEVSDKADPSFFAALIAEWNKNVEYMKSGQVLKTFTKSGYPVVDEIASVIPNISTCVAYPCVCPDQKGNKHPIHVVIIHLNDHDRWPREAIAKWLDRLDIDLTLQPTNKGN